MRNFRDVILTLALYLLFAIEWLIGRDSADDYERKAARET